ncbi:MAG: DUF1822 family protein [Jaaginema sp. PMC 1079.18]|nr:DUF1822 family protein [Jaaginema sp. PMC 1080.18]MEC4852703.1 DUF1822 family protein [Jaaginema sp. PMC 1079.18]MEC4867882.1 DUF1822 family protein [Jaaginema sp. PMC 1078.18]
MSLAVDTEFDFVSLSPDDIELSATQITTAIAYSQSFEDLTQQWQAYLTTLGQEAVQEWLRDRLTSPRIQLNHQSAIATQLEITGFKLNIIVLGSVTEANLAIPQAWLHSPSLAAHFYIVVEVLEDIELARIYGFCDRAAILAQNSPLRLPNADFMLSLAACDRELDTLLLYLRCLDPATMPLPQPRLNVATWLQNQLDELAATTAWILLPIFAPNSGNLAPAMRSSVTELPSILEQIQQQDVPIAVPAYTAFRDIHLDNAVLRLYAVTWLEVAEWHLVVILGTPSGTNLPDRTLLRISDDREVLLEQTTASPSQDPYLYAYVIGELQETFTVEIAIADGTSITLPPFAFER